MVVTYGTLDLNAMVYGSRSCWGAVPAWGIFVQPVAFLLFLTAAIAENKRIPVRSARVRIGAGRGLLHRVHRMKMGLFMLSEFIDIVVISALAVTLFLGGYNLPYLTDAGFVFPGRRERGRCRTGASSCCRSARSR